MKRFLTGTVVVLAPAAIAVGFLTTAAAHGTLRPASPTPSTSCVPSSSVAALAASGALTDTYTVIAGGTSSQRSIGTITLSGTEPLCSAVTVAATYYSYNTATSYYPQTNRGAGPTVTILAPGTYSFTSPTGCGQDDAYVTNLGPTPTPPATLLGALNPYEPYFLQDIANGPVTFYHAPFGATCVTAAVAVTTTTVPTTTTTPVAPATPTTVPATTTPATTTPAASTPAATSPSTAASSAATTVTTTAPVVAAGSSTKATTTHPVVAASSAGTSTLKVAAATKAPITKVVASVTG
jgi:hypothetical protein